MKYQYQRNIMSTSIYHNMSVSQSCLRSFLCNPYTVNSLNNGHFGARTTVCYSGSVLYWGIIA